ncbi:MAG TPA: SDR family NAD(P)-dependent oxidoreductase [Blastocatellia bacterium]|jgi:NAD(P)-dependent dehydrogenase (short-subunit alcohol dehydrogenase family)|nr:SDR family NAD(P)-dependent oxidoreductase [Blastocatellia bacterium]
MQANKLFDLGEKVALVTGGSRGIGFQMAEALGEMGAKLAISARKQSELDAASAALQAKNIEVLTVVNDLGSASPSAAESLVSAVLDRYGKIDVLVNNAGTVWGATAVAHTEEAWRKVMSLNVDACFFVAREVAQRSMIPNKSGKIINIASIAGLGGPRPDGKVFAVAYNTSKGALITLTQALATEWGKHNINVNALCPGYFPTKLSAGLADSAGEIVKVTPLGRAGGEYDIKGPIVFFASEASRHVSGQALAIDGGGSVVILN